MWKVLLIVITENGKDTKKSIESRALSYGLRWRTYAVIVVHYVRDRLYIEVSWISKILYRSSAHSLEEQSIKTEEAGQLCADNSTTPSPSDKTPSMYIRRYQQMAHAIPIMQHDA